MDTNDSKKVIIIGVIAIAIIAVLLIIINRKPDIAYTTGRSNKGTDGVLISTKKELDDLTKKIGIGEKLETNKYKKVNFSEQYNEDFFNNKKLAVIAVYEDDSKEYIHSIDSIKYNSSKSEVTINYTYKEDIYMGTLGNTWYTIMLVEIDPSVTTVNFVNSAK